MPEFAADAISTANPHSLLLVDASIYLFRGYFSLPQVWHDSAGVPTNAVLGFARALFIGLQTHGPSHIAVAFDESLTTCFRNELYPPYKAQRPPPDESLVVQMAYCRELVGLLGVFGCADARFEADDFIASLVQLWRDDATTAAGTAWLMTRDKDFGQLLNNDMTHVWDTAGEPALNRSAFELKYRVLPERFPDYQALVGDKVDNIPGVPGVGATTAAQLLQRFASLEEIFANLPAIKRGDTGVRRHERVAEDLHAARERVFLMRELTRLRHDLAPVSDVHDLRPRSRDDSALQAWLQQTGLTGALRLPVLTDAPQARQASLLL